MTTLTNDGQTIQCQCGAWTPVNVRATLDLTGENVPHEHVTRTLGVFVVAHTHSEVNA